MALKKLLPLALLLAIEVECFLSTFLFKQTKFIVTLCSQLVNCLDQISVGLHILLVVRSVALSFNSDPLVKVSGNALKILQLGFVLFLDFLVHLLSLALEVLDVGQKAVVDGALKLLVVIDILDDPVNGVLESADDNLIGLDFHPRLLDHRLHLLLTFAQVIHQVPKRRVRLVKLPEFFVHLVGLTS